MLVAPGIFLVVYVAVVIFLLKAPVINNVKAVVLSLRFCARRHPLIRPIKKDSLLSGERCFLNTAILAFAKLCDRLFTRSKLSVA